ncbi:MAG: dynamin family protein [Gracilibacteraceae bacterium]|nr:dynamin family protein [Gracilibacteraceae bacterium]
MKKVFIKYNPYKLETEITIDGKGLKENSEIGRKMPHGSRLQEWVEELPRLLKKECNDIDFDITFHGTVLDFEDLTGIFRETSAKLNHIPAKETSDKEGLIAEIFQEVQGGPFEELRDEAIIKAFELARSSDFEVCVVATMSAGKSTLINAMLGTKLMPSKQEACTAIITRIKDCSREDVPFKAEVYDKDGRLVETYENLTRPTMERLNADENVSTIAAAGNIPFVMSEDVSLVLIDTPGPNNSRDRQHEKVQSELLAKSSKALVLYIMTSEFGTDDDNKLLARVADSMKVGGKQSKDRFIFVVNKLDGRNKEDGDLNETLERVRSYLKDHGVANPNLFPAAALPALNIRLMKKNCAEIDEEDIDETETRIRKLNRSENLHFEKHASLPKSVRGEISEQLGAAARKWDGNDIENPDTALIHTGVVSIEAAIRQYVQKYAKTAKIKNIVDTFMKRLEEVGCFEETKRDVAKNRDENAKIVEQIAGIRRKMGDIRDAAKFKDAVAGAVAKVNDGAKATVEKIIETFQGRIRNRIYEYDVELDVEAAEEEAGQLGKFAKALEPQFEIALDAAIRVELENTGNALLDAYKQKLASLTEEINVGAITGVKIDPLKFMSGSVTSENFSTRDLIKTKKVESGEEWMRNTDKRWFKPWTWPQEKGYFRTKYQTVQYISGSEFAQEFFQPIQQGLYANGNAAYKYALKQSEHIAERFNEEFEQLDTILKGKLDELNNCATDKKNAEIRVKESERRLEWLEQIQLKMESILEI